jgi:hypothetical protein
MKIIILFLTLTCCSWLQAEISELDLKSLECKSYSISLLDGKVIERKSELINYKCTRSKDGNVACATVMNEKVDSDIFKSAQKENMLLLMNDDTTIFINTKTKHAVIEARSWLTDISVRINKICHAKLMN